MSAPDLDAAGLRAYVLGSLHLRGAAHEDLTPRVRRALGWYLEVQVRAPGRGRGRPLGVLFSWVHDLGHLLVEGDTFAFRSLQEVSTWRDPEREVRLEYENQLLNALLRDPRVRAAIESIRRDPTRDELVARTVGLLLAPLAAAGGHEDAPVVDTALLRELAPHQDEAFEDLPRAYDAVAGKEGALLEAHRSSLRRYLAARGAASLLGPDDLAEIEHWSAFRRGSQRAAARLIARRAASLPRVGAGHAARSEDREADTELPDSGYYPEGGFSELATQGSIENLNPSELLYMGEDPFGDAPSPPIDLFSLRYVEDDLLFFQRESGRLRRTRRVVHVAVAPDEWLRGAVRNEPRLAMVLGLLVRLGQDLAAVFPQDALQLHVHVLAGAEAEPERAAEDCEVLRVLLRHEVARGAARVTLEQGDLDLRARGERARRVYVIAVQSGDRQPAGLAPGEAGTRPGVRPPRVVVWKVGGAPPAGDGRGDGRGPRTIHTELERDPDAALALARDLLLAEVAGAYVAR